MLPTFAAAAFSIRCCSWNHANAPGIHVGVTDDLVKRGVTAPDVVNRIAALTGGKGGGRPHFASAGAGNVAAMREAEQQAPAIVREALMAHS